MILIDWAASQVVASRPEQAAGVEEDDVDEIVPRRECEMGNSECDSPREPWRGLACGF